MYSYTQTGPSADTFPSWDTPGEGTQNFHDFPNSHSGYLHGDSEDTYQFGSAAMTPPRTAAHEVADVLEEFSMKDIVKRQNSRSPSAGSRHGGSRGSPSKGQSRLTPGVVDHPRMTPAGTSSAFQVNTSLLDITTGSSLLNSQASLPYYEDYMAIAMEPMGYGGMSPHLNPTLMHLEPEAILAGNSPGAASWSFTPPDSPPDETPDGFYQHSSSSDLGSHSPLEYPHFNNTDIPDGLSYAHGTSAHSLTTEEFQSPSDSSPVTHSTSTARRVRNTGDSARDHDLYKNVTPGPDGLLHCPWEGDPDCHHKPEKLKCNYDKFVDSHLRPYRCMVESCESARFSSTACRLRHEREAHGMHGHQVFKCIYTGCERSLEGKGFPRAWNLKDHMRRVHNDNSTPPDIRAQLELDGGGRSGAKQRKREKTTSTTKRKASKSSSDASPSTATVVALVNSMATSAVDQMNVTERQEWAENVRELEVILNDLKKPGASSDNLRLIKKASKRLEKMSRLCNTFYPGGERSEIAPAPIRRSHG